MKLLTKIRKFELYCNDFYNENYGIYPIASEKEIGDAIEEYITAARSIPCGFDSIDREQVRRIIGK